LAGRSQIVNSKEASLGFRVIIIYLDDIILLNQCKIFIVEQLDFIKKNCHSGLPVESAEGRSVVFIDLPTLAGSAVVPNAVEHGMRYPSGLEAKPMAPEVCQREDEPIMQRPGLPVSRL
jgi:hypothetical protein